MKKRSKVILVCGLTAAIIGTTAFVAVKAYQNSQSRKEEDEEPVTISDTIYTDEEIDESDKIKKELEDIKAKETEDIKIPDDATEEEKEALEEQITYLSALGVIRDLQTTKVPRLISYREMDTEILKINKIQKINNNLFINAEVVVKDGEVFFVKQVYYEIFVGDNSVVSSSSVEEFVEKLEQAENPTMREIYMLYEKDDVFCQDIYTNYVLNYEPIKAYADTGYTISLVHSGMVDPGLLEHPNKCILEMELEKGDKKHTIVLELSFSSAQEQYGYEALRDKVKTYDPNLFLYYKNVSFYDNLNIDFSSVYEEITKSFTAEEEAGASAASAFETEDGFDYPAYVAAKAENEAKKAKSASDETVLAVGENGRITIKNSDLTF